jgi:hypothetical protein
MLIEIELPSALEGEWSLVDGSGKTLLTSAKAPDVRLMVEPHFYKGQYTQSLFRTIVSGKKGRKVEQTVKVSAGAGKLQAEVVGKLPKPIEPTFDRKPPTIIPPPPPEGTKPT